MQQKKPPQPIRAFIFSRTMIILFLLLQVLIPTQPISRPAEYQTATSAFIVQAADVNQAADMVEQVGGQVTRDLRSHQRRLSSA